MRHNEKHDVFRDGKVHVCCRECATCIFRPGNLMHLNGGRLREMVESARKNESTIVCHKTLNGPNAACRGFFNRYPTQPLQIAQRLDMIVEIDPDEGGSY